MSGEDGMTCPQLQEDWDEILENGRWAREVVNDIAARLGRVEKMVSASCPRCQPSCSRAGSADPGPASGVTPARD